MDLSSLWNLVGPILLSFLAFPKTIKSSLFPKVLKEAKAGAQPPIEFVYYWRMLVMASSFGFLAFGFYYYCEPPRGVAHKMGSHINYATNKQTNKLIVVKTSLGSISLVKIYLIISL